MVLAIDTSRSMQGKPIADAILAARAFALHRNPHQPLAIVTFDNKVKVLQPFTTDPSKIGAALRTVPTLAQGTRIYDGLDQSLSLIAKAHPASSEIVLLSDGADVGSVAKPAPVLRRLARQHTRVFSVGLASSAFDPQTLGRVARASGGSFVRANQPSDLQRIFAAISARLASEYLLRYRTVVPAGQRVAVKVVAPGVEPATASYVAPRLVFKDPPPYKLSSTDRLIQSPLAMVLVVLVIALLLGLGIANIARRRPDPLVHRVGGFVTLRSGPVIAEQPRRVPLTARIANRRRQRNRASIGARIAPTLELAGIGQSATEVILLTLGATILVALILNLLMGPLGILLAVLVVPLGARSFVLGRLRRKRRLFAEQLPDNLEVLTASLRSGHSLVGALAVVAADAQEPSKSEFNRVVADEQFGMPLEDALKVTVERMDESRSRPGRARRPAPAGDGSQLRRGARSCRRHGARPHGAAPHRAHADGAGAALALDPHVPADRARAAALARLPGVHGPVVPQAARSAAARRGGRDGRDRLLGDRPARGDQDLAHGHRRDPRRPPLRRRRCARLRDRARAAGPAQREPRPDRRVRLHRAGRRRRVAAEGRAAQTSTRSRPGSATR